MVNNKNALKKMENEYEILRFLFSESNPVTSDDLFKGIRGMKRTAFFSNLRELIDKNGYVSKTYINGNPVYTLTPKGIDYYKKDVWRVISDLIGFQSHDYEEDNDSGLYRMFKGVSFNIFQSTGKSALLDLKKSSDEVKDSIINRISNQIKMALNAKTLPKVNPGAKVIFALNIDYEQMYQRINTLRIFIDDLNKDVSYIFKDTRLGFFYGKDKKRFNLEILFKILSELEDFLGKSIEKKINKLFDYISDNKEEFLEFINGSLDMELLNRVIDDIKKNKHPLDDLEIKNKLVEVELTPGTFGVRLLTGTYLGVALYILHKNKELVARIEKFTKENHDKESDIVKNVLKNRFRKV